MSDRPTRVVYTALIGGYEALNEQPMAVGSDMAFVCFTDNPHLRSQTWQIRPVRPLFELDPIRSQRVIKLRPHQYLADYNQSLYIDNALVLDQPPEVLFGQANLETGFSLAPHPHRNKVIDEFWEVAQLGLDDTSRVFEQLNHYAALRPEVLQGKPFTANLMLRDHRNPKLVEAMETWLAHILRFSRRDQLSLSFALDSVGLRPHSLLLDYLNSPLLHFYAPQRNKDLREANPLFLSNLMAARQLETESVEQRFLKVQQQMAALRPNLVLRILERLRWARNRVMGRFKP